MKRYCLAFIMLISIKSFSQEIPFKVNLIRVKGVVFKDVVNELLDSGYLIAKIDSNYNTVETEKKDWNNNGFIQQMILRVRVKDSIAYITGLFGFPENDKGQYKPGSIAAAMGGINNPIQNLKSWQHRKRPTAWTMMNNFALSFNKPIEYKIQ